MAAPGGVWISKRLMSDLSKCEGLFASTLLREGPPFEHSEESAIGSLLHRAIKEDIAVGSADRTDAPDEVCRAALGKLLEADREFAAPAEAREILGLRAKGLRSVTLLPLGYRDAANDWLLQLKKVRRKREDFILEVK